MKEMKTFFLLSILISLSVRLSRKTFSFILFKVFPEDKLNKHQSHGKIITINWISWKSCVLLGSERVCGGKTVSAGVWKEITCVAVTDKFIFVWKAEYDEQRLSEMSFE